MNAGADQTLLNLDEVTRSYVGTQALSPLSLELSAGVTLGLLGPNGAGKTTLLSIMACVLAPTSGRVTLAGHPVVTESDAREARKAIGFLPQKPSCVPSFTALETVEYTAWLKGVHSRERTSMAMELLDRVGLGTVVNKQMRKLSGGMVQRVFLAAALVARPRVLLLDEPTVGLDPAQRLQFRSLVMGLDDVAVVLSTHLVEDIAVVASSVAVLDEGVVRFRGTPADLAEAAVPNAPGDTAIERGYMSILGPAVLSGSS